MIHATELDIGPLTWVKSEIDQALARASEALEKAKGTADDSASVQFAQTHLHQARGALSIIGLDGLTHFTTTLDLLLNALANGEIAERDKALDISSRALAVIGNYLEELVNGAPDQPLRLYPLYAEMVAVRQNNPNVWVSPSDLFFPDLTHRPPRRKQAAPLSDAELANKLHAVRAQFERGLLQWLKQPKDANGIQEMHNSITVLETLTSSATQYTLWWTAEAFFDGLQQGGLSNNPEIKQICATLHREIRRLPAVSQALPERLMRSLLYWISQTPAKTERQKAVHNLWHLDELVPETGSTITETPLGPLLKSLHQLLEETKQRWDRFCNGETAALQQFVANLKQLADNAQAFGRPALHRLLKGINTFMVWLCKDPKQFSSVVAIEVAGSLLLAETSLDRGVPESSLNGQVNETLARFSSIVRGDKLHASDKPPETSTIRQSQEDDAQKQVTKEVLSNLAQIEQALDDFFRDSSKREPLAALETPLKQIEGIMTLLGEPKAVTLLQSAAETIAGFADGSVEPEQERFETLAQQLSALGFFVDALQRGSASIDDFLYPEKSRAVAEPQAEEEYESVDHGTAVTDTTAKPEDSFSTGFDAPTDNLSTETATLEEEAFQPPQPESAPTVPATPEAVEAPVPSTVPASPLHAPEAFTPSSADSNDEELDAELLDIFLEEAQEVLATISSELKLSSGTEANLEHLTAIRRGFHTLKGSGRMVGLSELGEAAWSVEQTMNRWLQFEWPLVPALRTFIEEAHDVFLDWTRQISAGEGQSRDVTALVAHSERLRALESIDDADTIAADAPDDSAIETDEDLVETSLEPFVVNDLDDYEPAEALPVTEEFNIEEAASPEETLETREIPAEETAAADNVPFDDVSSDAALDVTPLDEPVETLEAEPVEDEIALDEASAITEEPSVIEAEPPEDEEGVIEAQPLDEEDFFEAEPLETTGQSDETAVSFDSDTEPLESEEQEIVTEETEVATDEQEEQAALQQLDLHDDEDIGITDLDDLESDIGTETDIGLESGIDDVELAGVSGIAEEFSDAGADETKEPDTVRIGDTELSSALFGLFIGEAHQHIDILHEDFEHLGRNPTLLPSEQAHRSAHTLAGISGTARFSPPQELARALEHALIRLRKLSIPPTSEQLALLMTTHDVLAAMLAEIEAHTMPLPVPELQEQLETIGQETTEVKQTVASPGETTETQEQAADAAIPEADAPWPHAEYSFGKASEQAGDSDLETGETAKTAPKIQDELDEQLLPIFLEESEDLLSQLRATLRTWQAGGDAASSAHASARLLHTLKGGSRMAGAMQLGEFIHQLESQLEDDLQHKTSPDVIEMLENGLDQAEEMIAALTATPAQSEASPAPQPTTSAVSPAPAATPEIETPQDTSAAGATLRVRADLVDRFVNDAGEIGIARTRIEGELRTVRRSLLDLTENVIRLRNQLREIEIQAEVQMQSRMAQAESKHADFDPLEMDRFTRLQELTRMMAESVSDVTTVQQNLLKNLDSAELTLQGQARLARELQQSLMQVRMVPFHSLADRLHRIVRQSAKDLGKRVNLDIRGGTIEIDRSVLEHVTVSLEHLLRNAISHGIETPEQRRAAGKNEIGQITLTISHEGNEIAIVLSDDGAGLNYQAIAAKGRAKGLLGPNEEADERRLANMIFLPGFSTSDNLSAVSGRGVGMDVVRSETASVGGRVDIQSTTGAGTEFHIRLPLTLAVTQALLVQAAGRTYAIPSNMITQVLEVYAETLEQLQNAGGMDWQGMKYQYHYLPRLLGDMQTQPEVQRFNWILLLRTGSQTLALHVDSLKGNQEIVVKHAGPQLVRIVGISGATVLGDGEIVLIINPVAMANRGITFEQTPLGKVASSQTADLGNVVPIQPTIMIVDDSLTVRKITGRLLEREGYKVVTAKDGSDALEKLLEPPLPDVILSDIEMPRMDGFDLLRNIRADERTKSIPVVMITSRLADKHRELAEKLGANNYLGKPFVEDELLSLLKDFTGGSDT